MFALNPFRAFAANAYDVDWCANALCCRVIDFELNKLARKIGGVCDSWPRGEEAVDCSRHAQTPGEKPGRAVGPGAFLTLARDHTHASLGVDRDCETVPDDVRFAILHPDEDDSHASYIWVSKIL
ncbi:MAG: hypothetical protein ABSF98_29440 [Bryobacteraceae bacterium]